MAGQFSGVSSAKAGTFARIAGYYAGLFLVTHAASGLYLATGGSWRRPDSLLFANLIMLLPGVIAAGIVRWCFHEPVRRTLGLSFVLDRWSLLAWLLPVGLSIVTLFVGLALPGASYSPELAGLGERFELSPEALSQLVPPIAHLPLVWSLLAQGIVLGPTVCTLTGLGEELGWRGLLVHELASFGFWRRSWLIGLLWGSWHVPLVFEGYGYPHHPLIGAALLIVFTLLASPLYVFLRERSGSVLTAAIAHGSFGASMLLTFAPIAGGSELTAGLIALPGILVMVPVNIALFFALRARSSAGAVKIRLRG